MPDCNCNSSYSPSNIYSFQYTYDPSCVNTGDCGNGAFDAKCVTYSATNLTCSGINSGDSLETALQKIDALVCQSSGDYSTYNVHCLNSGGAITTEAGFVDVISNYVCTLNTSLTTFLSTTFPAYQASVTAAIGTLPAITCTLAGVTSADSVNTILTKYCTKFTSIDSSLDISTVVWNNCFTVGTSPTTIAGGFSTLADQICQVKALVSSGGGGAVLPTFNNSGSCLSISGVSDTLSATVNALRTRVCLSPTFDINALTWGCITKPSSVTTNLQGAFQSVLTKVDSLSKALPTTFSGDFVVTNVDNTNLCLGKNIALVTPLNIDRFVAVDGGDVTPGVLIDKLQAGTNMSFDNTTTPGRLIINSTGGASNGEVYADSTDDTLGFLVDKVEGFAGDYISISTVYDSTTKKVRIAAFIDESGLITSMLDLIANDSVLKATFCSLVSSCPSPCESPSNIQAIAESTTTTTTSTSTTP